MLIVIIIVGAVVGAVITAALVMTHREPATARTDQPGESAAVTPTADTDRAGPTSTPSDEETARPAPTPTGAEHGRGQPAVGECVDTSRDSTGVVLYRADCSARSTPLVLDRVVPADQRCEPHGYASLAGFDGSVMCFAWSVRRGDCLQLEGPRKAQCDVGQPPNSGTVTVTDVRVGDSDGAGCADPNRWLQAGAGETRGVACFMPTTMVDQNGSVRPTR